MRVRVLRQLFTNGETVGKRVRRGREGHGIRFRANIRAQVNRELRARNARMREKRAALEL